MLFNLFSKRAIPAVPDIKNNYQQHLASSNSNNRDWSAKLDVITPWSEVSNNRISYIFNNDGFRSAPFNGKPELIALGCSVTFGHGLPLEATWPDLLFGMIPRETVRTYGNISYSGGSPMKAVSAFFSILNQYDFVPKIVVANFPNLERFWFSQSDVNGMGDWFLNPKKFKFKAVAPYRYDEVVPIEQAYFSNLDYIKILETFCISHGIKFVWSTWSTNLTREMEQFICDNFPSYINDTTRDEWKPDFEYFVDAKDRKELIDKFSMKNWDNIRCHEQYSLDEIFDFGLDIYKNDGSPHGEALCWPHPGMHRHLHWAEMYYSKLFNQ